MEHVSNECQCEGKKCTKCEKVQCLGNYTKDKRLKSKLKSQCRICQNASGKVWRQENAEYHRTRKATWLKANPEKESQTRKLRYYKRKGRGPLRRYRLTPEERKQYSYENNARGYARRREEDKQRAMAWRKENPRAHAAINAKRRTRKVQAGGSYTAKEWFELCAKYNNRCLRCGKTDVKLQADHVIPVAKLGSSDISNIQPLCKSCNSWKKDKFIDFRTNNS